MSPPVLVPDERVRFLLKEADELQRSLTNLDRGELEVLRAAVDSTLASRSPADHDTVVSVGDASFSCEWWPPD